MKKKEVIKPVMNNFPKGWEFSAVSGTAMIETGGLKISGKIIGINLDHFKFGNPKFFEIEYGMVNDQWDQIAIRDKGAAILVPYTIDPNGLLFVAGGYEFRPLLHGGEQLFTPPGGRRKVDDLKNEWQHSIEKALEGSDCYLNDLVMIGNTVTNRSLNIKNQDDPYPTTFYAIRICWDDITPIENDKRFRFKLKNHKDIDPKNNSLFTLEFLEIHKALEETFDGIAIAAYAKTLAAVKSGLIH
jgi:hypothetical protein